MYTPGQTLKSALQQRVSVGQAQRLGSQRNNLGEGMMCPASAGHLMNDIYMRPVSQNTLLLNDSACSNYTMFSAQRRMQVENQERPALPTCTAGLNSPGDTQGGRKFVPSNIYGEGPQGNFVRHYNTRSNRAPDHPEPLKYYYQKAVQPFNFSMDADIVTVKQ